MQIQAYLLSKLFKLNLAPIRTRRQAVVIRLRLLLLFLPAFLGFSPLFALSSVHALTTPPLQTDSPMVDQIPSLPASFGKIVYRFNAKSHKQLYIVGISHRAPFLGSKDGRTTIQTQSELYRIGEWLRHNRGLDLLLPEGFFYSKKALPPKNLGINNDLPKKALLSLDDESLEKRLSDHTRFVNAEMLLMNNYRMQVGQVEDRGLYDEVYDGLFRIKAERDDSQDLSRAASEIDRLQKNRTAFILQKAPAVIDEKFAQGKIQNRHALLTIGLNHLQDIIRSINKNEINIDYSPAGLDKYAAPLNLIKEGFGIVIIIPQVLASDSAVMEMTGLDGILMAGLEVTAQQ